jgi:predicted RNase H-like nuclease (RuvC/YqgF family)
MSEKLIIKTVLEHRWGTTVNINNVDVDFDKKGFATIPEELSSIIDNEKIFLSNADKSSFQTKDELIEELNLTIETLSTKLAEGKELISELETKLAKVESENLKLKTSISGKEEVQKAEDLDPKPLSEMTAKELEAVAEELNEGEGDIIDIKAFKAMNKAAKIAKLEEILKG